MADHVERDTRLGEHLGGDAPIRGEQRGQQFHRSDRTGAGDSIDNDASSLCGEPFEHGNYLPFSRSERSIDSDCADAYFLWTGLTADLESFRDRLPGPSVTARIGDLNGLEFFEKTTQRSNSTQSLGGIRATGGSSERGCFGHVVNLG